MSSRHFTRGIIILTVLLLSIVVSFFLGKLLGNELMADGREHLDQFTEKPDASVKPVSPMIGSLGPT